MDILERTRGRLRTCKDVAMSGDSALSFAEARRTAREGACAPRISVSEQTNLFFLSFFVRWIARNISPLWTEAHQIIDNCRALSKPMADNTNRHEGRVNLAQPFNPSHTHERRNTKIFDRFFHVGNTTSIAECPTNEQKPCGVAQNAEKRVRTRSRFVGIAALGVMAHRLSPTTLLVRPLP